MKLTSAVECYFCGDLVGKGHKIIHLNIKGIEKKKVLQCQDCKNAKIDLNPQNKVVCFQCGKWIESDEDRKPVNYFHGAAETKAAYLCNTCS